MSGKVSLAIVSGLLHHSQGGPAAVVQRQFHALTPHAEVTVLGVAPVWQQAELQRDLPGCHLFPPVWPQRWFRGAGLLEALWRVLPNCDVVHAHMLWDHPVWAAWHVARALNKPLIITPHGSLMEPWRYQAWHKQLYRRLLLDRMLRSTAFLQALSPREEQACRQAGVATPIRVIPNGLEPAAFLPTGTAAGALERWPFLTGKRVLFYLGRLWEEKGVVELVTAWAQLCHEGTTHGWHLVLAGADYRGGRQRLLQQLQQLGIQQQVSLPGEVTGLAKADLFASGSGFVLPSRSEGLSSALLESMAAALPAVYTQGCHFPALARWGGGIEVANGTEGVQQGLRQLLALEESSRRQMGARARELARQEFTMERVTRALLAVYQEAIHQQATATG
ncbi:MAG: glycosyltransferase [Magnetococcales bacterium]|nr:glycosyltransferase [Magnetococcales bacterium]